MNIGTDDYLVPIYGLTYTVLDWSSVYGETRNINTFDVTYVHTFRMWFRVVKTNVSIHRFFDDIKCYFGIPSVGYIILRRAAKEHILFPFNPLTDQPFHILPEGEYDCNTAAQVRRIFVFREIFAITSSSEKSLLVRDGIVLSINERNSLCLTRQTQFLTVLTKDTVEKWFLHISPRDIVRATICNGVTKVSLVLMLQKEVAQFSRTGETAAILHYGISKLMELTM